MAPDKHIKDRSSGPEAEKKAGEPQAQTVGDLCRCKETSLMKPRQLFQRMIDDLSFWRRSKKG